MPTYTPIMARSPFTVSQSGTAGDDIKCELYLWNDPDSQPASATETLSKPIPSSLITQVDFDISPYCREYITHTTYTEITSQTAIPVGEYCYCTVKLYKNDVLQSTTYYTAFDGFGYYEEDYNPTFYTGLMTDGTYQVSDTGNGGAVYIHDDQTVTWEAVYVGLDTGGGGTTVTITNEHSHVPYVHTSYVGEGNTLTIKRNSVTVSSYTFEEVCEDRYTVIDCDFVNKFGVWQRLVFFKASQESMEMNNTEYDLMSSSLDYDVTEARRQVFNVNGRQSIKCNTGWVDEGYSNVIKELLLSEQIRLDNKPVKLKTKSVQLFKHINDKTINYEVEFEYAYDMRNYVV